MKQQIIAMFATAFIAIGLRAAEISDSPEAINWGSTVCGAQLSVSLSSNVVSAGTEAGLCYRIRNLSTNAITIDAVRVPPAPRFALTNASGKKYELVEWVPPYEGGPEAYMGVSPGKTNELCVTVILGKELIPGEYIMLPVSRNITTAEGKTCTLVSGIQKLQIK